MPLCAYMKTEYFMRLRQRYILSYVRFTSMLISIIRSTLERKEGNRLSVVLSYQFA